MIDILISILGLQIFFIILKTTKVGRVVYLLGNTTKQMLILNCNILRLLLKKTKDINKKLKDKIYSKQDQNGKVNYKKVINFKSYKKKK
ncbi:hypothetical protein [Clostridium botulinum]